MNIDTHVAFGHRLLHEKLPSDSSATTTEVKYGPIQTWVANVRKNKAAIFPKVKQTVVAADEPTKVGRR
jgi:hypothetical protein